MSEQITAAEAAAQLAVSRRGPLAKAQARCAKANDAKSECDRQLKEQIAQLTEEFKKANAAVYKEAEEAEDERLRRYKNYIDACEKVFFYNKVKKADDFCTFKFDTSFEIDKAVALEWAKTNFPLAVSEVVDQDLVLNTVKSMLNSVSDEEWANAIVGAGDAGVNTVARAALQPSGITFVRVTKKLKAAVSTKIPVPEEEPAEVEQNEPAVEESQVVREVPF